MKKKSRNINYAGVILLALLVLIAGLIIFRVTASTASAGGNMPEARYKYYTSIQLHSGDTLWSIAETYMTDEYEDIYEYIDEVMEINHLGSDHLQAGSKLCVPYYSSEFKK